MNFWNYLSQNLTYLFIVLGALVIAVGACFLVKPAGRLLDKLLSVFAEKKNNKKNCDDNCRGDGDIKDSEKTENNGIADHGDRRDGDGNSPQ